MKLTATTRDTLPTVTWEATETVRDAFDWVMPAVSAATVPSMSKTVAIDNVSKPDTVFRTKKYEYFPLIKNVIFNPPATIVFWDDKTKTVVKVKEGEAYDPYTGLAMAICKKLYGNKYGGTFRKWTKKYYEAQEVEK